MAIVQAPEPFLITPCSEFEQEYGKPTLLTDCEIAVILDSIQKADPETEAGQEALAALWLKMLALWDMPAPKSVV